MQGNYIRRLAAFVGLLAIISTNNINADSVYGWSGEKYVTYNYKSSYEDGWSEWSTTQPTGVAMYVKTTVYLPATSWVEEGCSTETKSTITTGLYVRYERRHYDETVGRDADIPHEGTCGIVVSRQSLKSSANGCQSGFPGDESGWCSSNSSGACTGTVTTTNSGNCSKNAVAKHQCYYYIEYTKTASWTEKGSCHSGDYSEGNNGNGCSSRTKYCYNYSTTFKETKSDWKASLADAGGYAKTMTVYSYPLRVYFNYVGNGTSQICGNGDTASWSFGSNSYNSNKNILYSLGNPVCSTGFTTKSMSSASNSNSTTYVSYSNGGYLKENEYYKVGYDFAGWNTKADGSGQSFSDKEQITAATFKQGGKLYGTRGGDTITLYAQWKIHDYKVTYSYLCGFIEGVTYNYGTGITLKDLDTSSCESGSNTKFLGWFENIGYTSRLEKIPASYYKDITLYARERQVRYFDYSQGKWVYTTD